MSFIDECTRIVPESAVQDGKFRGTDEEHQKKVL